jgi:hypothetical protein
MGAATGTLFSSYGKSTTNQTDEFVECGSELLVEAVEP